MPLTCHRWPGLAAHLAAFGPLTPQPERDLLQTNAWQLRKAQSCMPEPYTNGQPRCLLPLFP